jgi:hemolysin activation/secretion protein
MKPCLVPLLALAACTVAFAAPPSNERQRERGRSATAFDFSATAYPQSNLPGLPGSSATTRLAASLTQTLPRDFLVRASVNTQYSPGEVALQDSLAPAPTTALRLMANRDALRDGGLGSNVELYSPDLCLGAARHCRALLYYDRNALRTNRALNGQLRSRNVGSAGIGVRMKLDRNSSMQLDFGRVVRSDVMPDDARSRLTLRYGYAW